MFYGEKLKNGFCPQNSWTVGPFPEADFSVSICSTLKFICSSDDGVSRLLITENDTSYKSNTSK